MENTLFDLIAEAMKGTKQELLNLLKETATLDLFGNVEDECVAAYEVVRDEYSEDDIQGFWSTFDGKYDLLYRHVWQYDNVRLELV